MSSKLLQSPERSTLFPDPVRPTTFARDMPDTSQTTSFTPLPPTVGDLEGAVPSSTPGEFDAFLPPVQKSLLPSAARSLLPSVSPLINAVRQNPLASATAVCAVLIGVTAGVVNLYYNWDWLEGDRIIQGMHNESGVSFYFCLTVQVGFKLARCLVDRAHRTWLSGGCGQQNYVDRVGGHRMRGILSPDISPTE